MVCFDKNKLCFFIRRFICFDELKCVFWYKEICRFLWEWVLVWWEEEVFFMRRFVCFDMKNIAGFDEKKMCVFMRGKNIFWLCQGIYKVRYKQFFLKNLNGN
jgi:hypothetical protein